MPTSLNSAGASNARARVAAGDVDKESSWSFSADDGNALLGSGGDDWANYGKWFLAVHSEQPEKTKAHYGYPFGKGGKVYRSGLIAAKQRAAQQGDTSVVDECTTLLDKIDAKKSAAVQRAYSIIDVKEIADDGQFFTFKGMASTPSTDRQGDVVEPMGANFNLPMPLLWQHQADKPVGHVVAAKATKAGIPFEARIPLVREAGTLKDRIDEAVQSIKHRLVAAVSIGFMPTKDEPIDAKNPFFGGTRFLEWSWLELSLVTIPANAEATISLAKSLDQAHLRAATGQTPKRVVVLGSPPGASGKNQPITPKGKPVKTIQEQIASFEAKRAASAARMDAIMEQSANEGRTLDAEETEEYENLKAEVKTVDEHLTRLKAHEATVVAKAKEVVTDDPAKGVPARSGIVLKPNSNLPKAIGMARYVKAIAQAKGNFQQAADYAKQQWDTSTPEVALALKSAVAGATTADSGWAGPLVYNQNLTAEFVEYLRPQIIVGKINGFRMVPFNVRFPTQSAGSTIGWVGEGLAKPVSKLTFSSATLGFAKVSGIVVVTMELARFSSPSAELLIRDDLAAQSIQFLDAQFIDPGVAAVSNVNPASVTNGAGNIVQSGAVWNTQANVIADIKGFLQAFAAQNIALDNTCYWVMTPAVAISLSMIVTANGVYAFPDISASGGSLYGIPVVTSNSVPNSVSAGSIVALVKANEIFLADDGQVAIDVSQEASLQMDSAPTESSAAPTATSVVSLWQTNSIGIRAERLINWARRRSYGVGYIDNVHTS